MHCREMIIQLFTFFFLYPQVSVLSGPKRIGVQITEQIFLHCREIIIHKFTRCSFFFWIDWILD